MNLNLRSPRSIIACLFSLFFLLSPGSSFSQDEEENNTLQQIEQTISELNAANKAAAEAEREEEELKKKKKKDKDEGRFFGMEWFDDDAIKLLFRFGINMLFVLILVRFIYYPVARRKDFLFTYMLISVTVFFLCFLLENLTLDLGFALGLFAVFGIIRYRTDPIPIKEMTYLFIIIGISVLNALVNKKISYTELFIANGAIVLVTYGLEKIWLLRHESFKIILYDNIELIQAGKREDLIEDLEIRTGIKINRVEIGRIDFLRDTALLRIYFYEDDQLAHYEESGS
ncbi:MAG: DUF4956 domain-containing protein [Bacteroidota bacterium]